MAKDMEKEKKWAEHMPSEGENPEHAARQSSEEGLKKTVQSPEYRKAAKAAPDKAAPGAAERNREFVEDIAMEYDENAEKFAKGDETRR